MKPFGNIFCIDLTHKQVAVQPFTKVLAERVLGGFGFNTWYLYHHLPHHTRALGPENILVISRGLLTGSATPASARTHISAKSPLSGLMGSSNVGGHIGAHMQSLGVAAMLIHGTAGRPVALLADESGVSFRSAEDIWGLDTRAMESVLRQGRDTRRTEILSIGVAGENQVPFTCIMNGLDHASGRTGLGAVMGSKNLKAIVVAGIRKRAASSPAIRERVRDYARKKGSSPFLKKGSKGVKSILDFF